MWLVICETVDLAALWAYHRLKARGLAPLELVTSEELAYSLHWEHWLTSDGAGFLITLPDGRELRHEAISGVLNRFSRVHSEHLDRARPSDRTYAAEEFSALFLSWLQSLPGPVLNRPKAIGYSGAMRPPSEWLHLAAQAGLPTRTRRYTSAGLDSAVVSDRLAATKESRTVIVAGETTFGWRVPNSINASCVSLAQLTRAEILGVRLTRGLGEQWSFADATPLPDLRLGGQALIDMLFRLLSGNHEGEP